MRPPFLRTRADSLTVAATAATAATVETTATAVKSATTTRNTTSATVGAATATDRRSTRGMLDRSWRTCIDPWSRCTGIRPGIGVRARGNPGALSRT